MTLSPTENRNVEGLSGDAYPDYKVGPLCCVPGCSKYADHPHHLWRRSQLGGPFYWVKLDDGTILGNVVPICFRCHDLITDNEAWIRWDDKQRLFVYLRKMQGRHVPPFGKTYWELPGPIAQPPIHGKPIEEPEVTTSEGPAAVETCPQCKRPLPHQHKERSKARRRKTWTVTVPADSEEDGGLVLDTLLEECRKLFAHDENLNTRYFSLVQALALVVQNGHLLIGDS